MTTWRMGVAAGVLGAALVLGLASCGDNEKGAAAPQLSPDPLTLEIQSATVPDFATTARPTVTFRLLDGSGNPIDLEAELATTTTFPNLAYTGARAPGFTLAMLDDNNDYISYYSTTVNPRDYTYIPDPELFGSTLTGDDVKAMNPPAPRTQAQANTVARGPNLTTVGNRVYQFTFPPLRSTEGFDRSKTHTVAGWVVRKPNPSDSDVAHASFNFIPTGTGTVQKIETITDEGCGRCHGFVQAHGTRRGVQFCITCHSPLTGDPETNRTVDFKVMIHKIHYGSGLPSVRQGKPYYIVGFQQHVVDFSDIAFPWHDHGVQHCTVCHQGKDQNNWKTKPSAKVCTSCHDNVQFALAEGVPFCSTLSAANRFQDCVHTGGPIAITNVNTTTACIDCHGEGRAVAIDQFHHGD